MRPHPSIFFALRQELYDWRLWTGRGVVLAFAALAGLTVVAFTWMTEQAFGYFFVLEKSFWWSPLLWTPASTAAIVWLTRRYVPGAAGSGIPQVMAALTPDVPIASRSMYVSVKLTLTKMVLTTWGLLAGLSLGREGPSVQIAAGVMHHARRWLPSKSQVSEHGFDVGRGCSGHRGGVQYASGGRDVCH